MKLFKKMGWGVIALCAGSIITACATYYKVTEPASGRTYYTEDIDHERGGAASFKDAVSGAEVTIQNSEILEIDEEEFDAGLAAAKEKKPAPPPAAPAAPPPAPAPSAAPAPKQEAAETESASAEVDAGAPTEESK